MSKIVICSITGVFVLASCAIVFIALAQRQIPEFLFFLAALCLSNVMSIFFPSPLQGDRFSQRN